MNSYHYPINETWTKEEVIDVVLFFNLVEKAYESSVKRKDLLEAYRKFKNIVPAKSEEKNYFSDFEKGSGYSSYHAVKFARESNQERISMRL